MSGMSWAFASSALDDDDVISIKDTDKEGPSVTRKRKRDRSPITEKYVGFSSESAMGKGKRERKGPKRGDQHLHLAQR